MVHRAIMDMVMKMKNKYTFTEDDIIQISNARKRNHDKQIEKRLHVLVLRYNGKKLSEIVAITGFARSHVSNLIRKYFEEGLSAISEKHYHGNRRNMSLEDEREFVEAYRKQAESGQVIEVKAIRDAYEKKVGHSIGKGQIYRVLGRHEWRKVMPRSRHPKKASGEAIEASKKLTTV